MKKKKKFNSKFKTFIFSFFLILIPFTIFQIGSLTTQFYHLVELENKIKKISNETQKIEEMAWATNLTGNLNEFIENEKLTKPKTVKYIQLLGSTVVVK